jgi:hypothetical protein
MEKTFRRTGTSELTDAELLLFDVLAMYGGSYRSLRADFFSLQYNYPSHELDNDSLKATLHHFEEENWIRSEDDVDPHSQKIGNLRLHH